MKRNPISWFLFWAPRWLMIAIGFILLLYLLIEYRVRKIFGLPPRKIK